MLLSLLGLSVKERHVPLSGACHELESGLGVANLK